jgi:hypothetical protein
MPLKISSLCPFEKTIQKSKANSAETTIGYWKGWSDDEQNKFGLMKFDNGLGLIIIRYVVIFILYR